MASNTVCREIKFTGTPLLDQNVLFYSPMQHLYLILFSALFALSAQPSFADQKLNVNIPGGGAQDMLNLTQVPPDLATAPAHPGEQRSCVTPHGRLVRETEAGYKECLAAAKGTKPAPSATTKP